MWMDRRSLVEALDQAVDCLLQGGAMEDILRQFPADADQLRPLVQVSADLWQLAQVPVPQPGSTHCTGVDSAARHDSAAASTPFLRTADSPVASATNAR